MLQLIREDIEGDHRYTFGQATVRIGRVAGNDLVLGVQHVSSRHAQIRLAGDEYLLSDLGSTNGSAVMRGEQRLLLGPKGAAELALSDGDLLLLGDIDGPVRLRVRIEQPPPALDSTVMATRSHEQTVAEASRRLDDDHRALAVIFRLVEQLGDERGQAQGPDRARVLARVAEAALAALPGSVDALVALRQGDDLTLVAEAHRGGQGSREPNYRICERVIGKGEAVLFGGAGATPLPQTLAGHGVGSGIACPLWREREVIGVLQVNCAPGQQALGEAELDLAAVLAHHAAQALERGELVARLRAAEARLRRENEFLRARSQPEVEVVATSAAMRAVLDELGKAATSDATVLLVGETGTGKELAARYLHQQSARRDRLLVPVNCGALTETLLDSELFGHKKGAFTGATSDRQGVFEVAAGGTVFLDEIGEMPLQLQVRLLRVLEEGKIKRVGETLERAVDARVVAATNRDLPAMIEEGAFRRDLYYRLRVLPVRLPPLRDRAEDIEPIARAYLARCAERLGKRLGQPDGSFFEALRNHAFPGNVRELLNEVERAAVRAAEGEALTAELLSEELLLARPGDPAGGGDGASLRDRLDAFERQIIGETLERHGGNLTAAADELGVTRQGLSKKLRRLGIAR